MTFDLLTLSGLLIAAVTTVVVVLNIHRHRCSSAEQAERGSDQ